MKTLFKILVLAFITMNSHFLPAQLAAKTVLTKNNKTMKILFVLTSHDRLGNTGEKTGFWIEEFATPYYTLTDKGFDVTIASPKGGQPPIDPKSNLPAYSTPATKRFNDDKATQKKLRESLALKNVKQEDYDAVFYPGGHGPLWDLSEDKTSIKLIEAFYNHNKPVSFVCHAPAALKNVKDKSGSPLVKGKQVTGFTNTEEAAVKLTDVVPFLVENMLRENGGVYMRGADWGPYAIQDGLLITGQNPASSELVAEKLMNALSSNN